MATTGALSEEDLAALCRLPVAAFHLVAAADGRVQDVETTHFATLLRDVAGAARPQDELVARVCSLVVEDLAATLDAVDRLTARGVTVDDLLLQGRVVLDEAVPPDQAMVFKHTLVDMATSIAGAYPPFARGPDDHELAAITRLAAALGLAGPPHPVVS